MLKETELDCYRPILPPLPSFLFLLRSLSPSILRAVGKHTWELTNVLCNPVNSLPVRRTHSRSVDSELGHRTCESLSRMLALWVLDQIWDLDQI